MNHTVSSNYEGGVTVNLTGAADPRGNQQGTTTVVITFNVDSLGPVINTITLNSGTFATTADILAELDVSGAVSMNITGDI